jgi:hypothetical protein
MDEPSSSKPTSTKIGPLLGIIVILALLFAGAVYFFIDLQDRFTTPPIQETINA